MKKYPLTNLYAIFLMGLVMGLGHRFGLNTLNSFVAGIIVYLAVIGYFISHREIYNNKEKI